MNSSILCFGEVLLRLSAPAGTRIANATSLSVHVGGAEANVGALLAQLGHHVEMLTVLPDSPIGDLCQAELRRTGLATGRSVRILKYPGRPFGHFTVSPDGMWFATSYRGKRTRDLMIIEHFR